MSWLLHLGLATWVIFAGLVITGIAAEVLDWSYGRVSLELVKLAARQLPVPLREARRLEMNSVIHVIRAEGRPFFAVARSLWFAISQVDRKSVV